MGESSKRGGAGDFSIPSNIAERENARHLLRVKVQEFYSFFRCHHSAVFKQAARFFSDLSNRLTVSIQNCGIRGKVITIPG